MSGSVRRTRVALVVGVLLPVVVLAGSGLVNAGYEGVPPEKKTGTVGSYNILDSDSQPGINCHYHGSPKRVLDRFHLQPVQVGWPNLNPSRNNEHGTVSWQVIVQREEPTGSMVWHTKWESPLVSQTVYESTSVPFQPRTIQWQRSGLHWFRVMTKLVWRRTDGSQLGTLRHWYLVNAWTGTTSATNDGGCVTEYTPA